MESKLEKQISAQLKQCCKDEASLSKLKKLFGGLIKKYKETQQQLYLLEQAIEQDYDSIMITELNFEKPGPKITYVNDGFTEMTGYSKSDVLGRTPRILQGDKTDQQVLNRLKSRLEKGYSFFGNTVNYKKDGSEFINQWDIHPLKNKKGEITHWISYQRDITDKNESDHLFFDPDIDYESLYEKSKKVYVDLDTRGNIISSNNAFNELLGYDADEIKEFKIWDFVTDTNKKEVEYLFSDFDANSIEEKIYLWEFKNRSGERIELESSISSFFDNGYTIVRLQLVNHTLRNRVIDSLKKKKQQLENILAKKDEFKLRFVREENGHIRCKYVSDSFASVTGLNPEIILSKGIGKVLHENNIPEADEAIKRAFKGEASTIHCKYKTTDGTYIPTLQSFKPVLSTTSTEVESVKSSAVIEFKEED